MPTNTFDMITTNLIDNGLLIGILLITFLVLKEVFSVDIDKNKKMKSFVKVVNIAIVPLFILFITVVVYKAMEILSNF